MLITMQLFQAYFTFAKIMIGQNYLIYSLLTIKQSVMCKKRLFFNIFKGNTTGPCLSRTVCMDGERRRSCQMQRMLS